MIEISRYEEKDKKEAMAIWNAIVHEDFFAKKLDFLVVFLPLHAISYQKEPIKQRIDERL